MDIHDVVPHVHLLAQETLQDPVGQEHGLHVEVRTDHQVRHRHVLRDDRYLVLVERHLLAVHLCLYLTVGTDSDAVHGDVGRTDLGKLLDAVDDDDVVVGIADIDVLIFR